MYKNLGVQICMTCSRSRTISTLLCAFLLVVSSLPAAKVPAGWFMAGSKPQAYVAGIDTEISRTGSSSAFLRSKDVTDIDGFGTLMQNVSPQQYAGLRVRLSGYAKSQDIEESAGFWMRVDAKDRSVGKPLAFDNMNTRPIVGTTDWRRYEIVLDVAQEALAEPSSHCVSRPCRHS